MITKDMRFKNWQGNKASSQQVFMDVAELIGPYLRKAKQSRIKQDVYNDENQSLEYIQFNRQEKAHRGVFLYCILDIEEAIDLLSSSKEHDVLQALKEDLVVLFNEPLHRHKSAQRIQNVMSNCDAFLKIKVSDSTHFVKVQELYYSIYLSLCIMDRSLSHLPPEASVFKNLYNIDITQLNNDVIKLLKQVEEIIMNIEVDAQTVETVERLADTAPSIQPDGAQPHEVELLKSSEHTSPTLSAEKVLTPSQEKIQKYFDERYRSIIISADSPQEKLTSLLGLVAEIQSDIAQQKAKVEGLLEAFAANDKYITGRHYFLDLKKLHEDAFQLLMELSSESNPKKVQLENNIKEQEKRIGSYMNRIQHTLSNKFSYVSVFGRILSFIDRSIGGWIPDMSSYFETYDSEAKKLIQELAIDVLKILSNELTAIEKEQQSITAALTACNKEWAESISVETSESLAHLAGLNAVQEHDNDALLIKEIAGIKENPIVHVKAPIQEAFQQHYVSLMNGEADENVKVSSLIGSMKATVEMLKELIKLQTQRNALLHQFNSVQAFLEVVDTIGNKFIGAVVAGRRLDELQKELGALDKNISKQASAVSPNNEKLVGNLIQCSVAELNELVGINTVPDALSNQLSSLAPPEPVVADSLPNEEAIQPYFNKRYLSLLESAGQEEQRLANVIKLINTFDEQINELQLARKHYEVIASKKGYMDAVGRLQKNHALLNTLTKPRADVLSKDELLEKQRVEALALKLAGEDDNFKKLLLQVKPDTLLQVLEANSAAKECIEHYKKLKDTISLLSDTTNTIGSADAYVKENNTWWVRLTNFLARLCSIFKSKTGEMIDKANALKGQLLECKNQCEQEIATRIKSIATNPNLGNAVLGDLPKQHQYDVSDEPVAPFDPSKIRSVLSSASMFNPKRTLETQKSADHLDVVDDYALGSCPN